MLTNNYKKWVNGILYETSNATLRQNLTDINGVTGRNGYANNTDIKRLDINFGAHTLDHITKNRCAALFVGTGDKEESLDDIALENIIPDSDLTMSNAKIELVDGKFVLTETFTYIGTNGIIVNEVALYKSFACGSSSNVTIICFARQKIEPLTVSNGDVFTVTMVIG